MTDDHDPSWIPKPRFRDFEHTEMIAKNEFPLFNIDNSPVATAQQVAPTESTHQPRASDTPVHVEIARNAILEPASAIPKFQALRPQTQAASNDLSFLDNPTGATDHAWRQTSGVQSPGHDEDFTAEARNADAPDRNGDLEEFDYYFEFNGADNDCSSPHQQTIAHSQDSDTQPATVAQLHNQDNIDDSAQRAYLLYVLIQVERLTGPSNPDNEHASDQRIARVNAMTPEEVHALSNALVVSVEQLRTAAPIQETSTPFQIATTNSSVTLVPAPVLDAGASHNDVPDVQAGFSPLDHTFSNPFGQVEWDDTEALNWNSSFDPTVYSFFPEDLFATS